MCVTSSNDSSPVRAFVEGDIASLLVQAGKVGSNQGAAAGGAADGAAAAAAEVVEEEPEEVTSL
jgi:hypothetical protein